MHPDQRQGRADIIVQDLSQVQHLIPGCEDDNFPTVLFCRGILLTISDGQTDILTDRKRQVRQTTVACDRHRPFHMAVDLRGRSRFFDIGPDLQIGIQNLGIIKLSKELPVSMPLKVAATGLQSVESDYKTFVHLDLKTDLGMQR